MIVAKIFVLLRYLGDLAKQASLFLSSSVQ